MTGILCVQGAFAEHEKMLDRLGEKWCEIRKLADLQNKFDRLILCGGESTTQGKLLRELGLFEPLREMILRGMPVFGTCAGLIFLAKEIENDTRRHFALMDIKVRRNGYGRQLGSFFALGKFGEMSDVPMSFIRAPYIESVLDDGEFSANLGCNNTKIDAQLDANFAQNSDEKSCKDGKKQCEKVQILAQIDGKIVAARQKNMLVTAFHPELNADTCSFCIRFVFKFILILIAIWR